MSNYWLGPMDRKRKTAILVKLILENDWIPHRPTEKQAEFLLDFGVETFFGGAAGGGKSDGLLMAATMFVAQPGYSALLLRRTYPELVMPEGLISRSHEWFGPKGISWSSETKTWTFPSGATISFGFLQHENDKYRYQGAAFQFIGFDELTHFVESQYVYLFSRLRRLEGLNIPLRIRAASNPGGVGHEWVKQRFIAGDGSRTFIPAKLEDNPYLDREQYEKSLDKLDPITRRQLRDGDWTARADGNLFRREWFHIIDRNQVPDLQARVRFWDLASTEAKPGTDPDWTAGCLMARDYEGGIYILDMVRVRMAPADIEKRIRQTAEIDGIETPVYMEQEPGGSGKSLIDYYARRILAGYAFTGVPSTGSKEIRANPYSAAVNNGHVYVVSAQWLLDFFDEHEGFPHNSAHDDQVDAASGAFGRLAQIPMGGSYPLRYRESVKDEYEIMIDRAHGISHDSAGRRNPFGGLTPRRPAP